MIYKLVAFVLYTPQMDKVLEFYTAFGFKFVKEQHAILHSDRLGPVHYSTEISGTVMEIYPATLANHQRLEFLVTSLHELSENMPKLGIVEQQSFNEIPKGGMSTMYVDPDGRKVVMHVQA